MIYYIRDEEESLIGIKYNNSIYYYIKNLQEDIIGITDNNYNVICRYEYDSWGRIITIKDNNGNIIEDESHIGIINPYRYRSYYYDKETKLYYLNSRYYNPEWGRFINADGIIGANKDYVSHNLYSYTSNIFIVVKDENGNTLMPTWNDIKNVAKKAVQIVTSVLSYGGGFMLRAPSASAMFNKSMLNPNDKMNKLTEHNLKAGVYNSSKMENAIKTCVEKNKNNFKYTCSGSTIFDDSKNLSLSIGKSDYEIVGYNNSISGITSLKVKVYDDYDFDEKRENNSFSNLVNNLGYFYQRAGLLQSYYWEINYYVNLPYQK